MADSPSKYKDRILSWKIYCDGRAIEDSFGLTFIQIHLAINRIGRAILKFNAGNMDEQTFDETDSNYFKPGNSIRIDVGDLNKLHTLFEGTILSTGIKLLKGARSQMIVECRDNAYQATQGRKNRIFEKKKDSDIIKEVLNEYGSVKVDATTFQFPEMVQYYCSDWDFALSRADANGMFIYTEGKAIKVFKPTVNSSPVLTVTHGVDMIDFDGSLSGSEQYSKFEAVSWDPATQKQVKQTAAVPTLNEQGDIAIKKLSGNDTLLLQTDAPTDKAALKEWADSQALKAGLARYSGSFSFYGAAEVVPGCIVELKGLGKRFNGNVYVGAVTHTVENNEWMTKVGMGVPAMNITDEADVVTPPASGFLPGMEGLHMAVVKKLDGDTSKEYRIQVELPWMDGDKKLLWARFSTAYAGNQSGVFFLPEPEDEVIVGFVNNDPNYPVVLGSMYGSKHKPPFEYEGKNNRKAIVTRTKMAIEFDEEKKAISIHTPGNNTIVISDDGKSITIADQNKNEVLLDANGIALTSAKDITLNAKGNITMNATKMVDIKATGDVTVKGSNVNMEAKMGAKVKGNASAEISASGQTIVKGAMVMIN